jgi:hypothetical protein
MKGFCVPEERSNADFSPAVNRWAIINRPYGTKITLFDHFPSSELLGYCRMSLRDRSNALPHKSLPLQDTALVRESD